MKIQMLFEKIQEQLQGANMTLLLLYGFLGLFIFLLAIWRLGPGIIVALSFIFSGLLITKSMTLNFASMLLRFIVVFILVMYAIFYGRNRVRFSKTFGVLLILPIVMIIDSARVQYSTDAFMQGLTFLMFFIGLIIGGQKILADERGRRAYVLSVIWFSIIMTCVQIPFMTSDTGLFHGAFETTVGFMIVGMPGVIFLVWRGMAKRIWSPWFLFFVIFALLTFVSMLLTGGRTALGGASLGILIILIRKLKRNVIVMLFVGLIVLPMGLRIVTSFPGFEAVRNKLFSRRSSGRAVLWARAIDEIKQKPMIGWGTGTSFLKAASTTGSEYHHSFLQWAIEHGILFGLLMTLLFLWLPIRGLLLMRRCVTEELKDMANLSSALLGAYVFSAFLSHALLSTTFILPVCSAIALQEGVRNENLRLLMEDGYNDYSGNNHEEYSWEQDYEQVALEEVY